MNNEKDLVAFLDILGFKNHVESFLNDEKNGDRQITCFRLGWISIY